MNIVFCTVSLRTPALTYTGSHTKKGWFVSVLLAFKADSVIITQLNSHLSIFALSISFLPVPRAGFVLKGMLSSKATYTHLDTTKGIMHLNVGCLYGRQN